MPRLPRPLANAMLARHDTRIVYELLGTIAVEQPGRLADPTWRGAFARPYARTVCEPVVRAALRRGYAYAIEAGVWWDETKTARARALASRVLAHEDIPREGFERAFAEVRRRYGAVSSQMADYDAAKTDEARERIRARSRARRDYEARYEPLRARRVPRDRIIQGRAYVIHARNGGIGVAVEEDGLVGYRLHRDKLGRHYLFVELDWEEDPSFGTAIPLRLIEAEPPTGDEELLAWLAKQEAEHRAEIDSAWKVVLSF